MNTERNLRRTELPSGLIVLTERMEHMRSVAMGVWTKSGSRCEPAETNGISHFVEHMLFKGTNSRTAQQIAREMDSIGGKFLTQWLTESSNLTYLSNSLTIKSFCQLFAAPCRLADPGHTSCERRRIHPKQ